MKQSNSGSSLMAVLILVCTMVVIMGAVFMMTTGEARFMKRSVDRTTAIAYADGVLESLFDQWRDSMSDGQNLTATQRTKGPTGAELLASPFSLAAPSTSSTSVLPPPSGMSLTSWSVNAATPYFAVLSSTSRPTLENGTNSSLLIRMYYIANATVSFRGGQVTVERVFTKAGQNIFNNFLFSTQPVTEIQPGAAMYVNGTIYVGGNLYLEGSNLNLQQDVSYTGTNTIGAAPNDTHGITAGTPSWPASDAPHLGAQQKLLDVVTSLIDQNFIGAGSYSDPGVYSSTNSITNNLNNKGYHELIEEQKTPVASNPDPLQIDTAGDNERLPSNADYRILINSSNVVSVYKGTASGTLAAGTAEYNAIVAAITTNTAFYDGRVGSTVRAVTLDVGKISQAYATGTILDNNTFNGSAAKDGLLLFVNDTSAGSSVTTNGYGYGIVASGTYGMKTSATNSSSSTITSSSARGVRLINSGSLPTGRGVAAANNNYGGLTIATPNPVYIQGDYNTGSKITGTFTSDGVTMSSTMPASNGGSAAYPSGTSAPSEVVTSSGTYAKQVSVIAADSVTILSNAWADSASGTPMNVADNTTVNAALVSGNVPTANASPYSGGIENFPRLLEDWGSKYLTIHGSFALLYNSEQATQQWKTTGVYYQAPSRRWFFDSSLQNTNPPGFPAAYTYTRGTWFIK